MPRQLQREAWRKASDDNKGRSPAVIRSENSRITLGVLENSAEARRERPRWLVRALLLPLGTREHQALA